jgi:Flp pilus assembly protein TadG
MIDAANVGKLNHVTNRQSGLAAVELALLAPILFFILFGIINWGILLYDKAVITNAAREGARWASINTSADAGTVACTNDTSTSNSTVCAVANSYAKAILISFSSDTLKSTYSFPTSNSFATGALQTVKVDYTFTGTGYMASTIIGSAGNLTATSSMYHE